MAGQGALERKVVGVRTLPHLPLLYRSGVLVALALLAALPALAAGGNPCLECHEDQAVALGVTPHRSVATESSAFCTACHGDGTQHLASADATDIRGPSKLRQWSPDERSAACLNCHRQSTPQWGVAEHRNEVSCWECHEGQALHWQPTRDALSPAPAAGADRSGWTTCTRCHPEVRNEFRLEYHHPVEEGQVRCVDCHQVHGAQPLAQAAEAATALCVRCHQEQSGPFLFEHPVITEDGCVACHRPHGSWNRDLLTSTGQGICISCHLQSNFPGVGQTPHDFRLSGGARCWDCHSDVHGSNTTPDFNPRGRR
ncbi:MAG TPA: hypothetical protein ENK10_00745 [Acidobacteria bacterium]|nr:hypothetical protein [Acidobacteriota bacterium]